MDLYVWVLKKKGLDVDDIGFFYTAIEIDLLVKNF